MDYADNHKYLKINNIASAFLVDVLNIKLYNYANKEIKDLKISVCHATGKRIKSLIENDKLKLKRYANKTWRVV